jgi:hypothetical protein
MGSSAVTDRYRRLAMPTSQNDAFAHAATMVVFPLLLGLLGTVIDHALGTQWVFAAVLATVGVIGAFASAYYRYQARIAQCDAGKPWTRRAQRDVASR